MPQKVTKKKLTLEYLMERVHELDCRLEELEEPDEDESDEDEEFLVQWEWETSRNDWYQIFLLLPDGELRLTVNAPSPKKIQKLVDKMNELGLAPYYDC